MNKKARDLFGDGTGHSCWKVLQTDQSGPCSFCTNNKLFNDDGSPAEPYVWEFQNTIIEEWWECRDRVIKWYGGRYVRLEIATNISERKLIKEQLRENEAKYRTLSENAPVTYHSLNEQGILIHVNPAWERVLGYSREEAIGQSVKDVLHPDWQPLFDQRFSEFKEKGQINDLHFKIRH